MYNILKYFGLIRISDVILKSSELHNSYVEQVVKWVEDDYGSKSAHSKEEAVKWWSESLLSLIENNNFKYIKFKKQIKETK